MLKHAPARNQHATGTRVLSATQRVKIGGIPHFLIAPNLIAPLLDSATLILALFDSAKSWRYESQNGSALSSPDKVLL